MEEKLLRFVDHAREKGLDLGTIRQLLVSVGWKEREVAEVFCARQLELPIPEPVRITPAQARAHRRGGSVWPKRARDGFLHLLTFGALHTWAISLIILSFIYVDLALHDPAWRIGHARLVELYSIIRAQLAIVIVAFPIFLGLWHFLLREVRRNPEKARGGVRRWLGYLAIFVGALTLSIDVITLLYYMLEGQLTARLLLKGGALFLIAGSLVLYLALTLRSETRTEAKP